MTELQRTDIHRTVIGEVVATNITVDKYMARYAESHCEWVQGTVIKMSPVHDKHDELTGFLRALFAAYFELKPIGKVRQDPFVLQLPSIEVARQPDLQVILDDNPHEYTPTAMIGPADLCVEVVSPESQGRDHGEKFEEYQAAGVREYWIIDPLRDEARFYQLNDDGLYRSIAPDANGIYRCRVLPGLRLDVALLWAEKLPGPIETGRMVQAMLS